MKSERVCRIKKAILLLSIIIGAVYLTYAQDASNDFSLELYNADLKSLLEKSNEPNAYKGRIALDFANYYNRIVKEHPDQADTILSITLDAAAQYKLQCEMSGSIMSSAQFESSKPPASTSSVNNTDEDIPQQYNLQPPVCDEIYKVVERMPRFPGCEDLEGNSQVKAACAQKKLLEFLYNNQTYPAEALREGIEGRSVVQFNVEVDGTITDINVVRSLGYGIDEESYRLVEMMNHMDERWTPGAQRGQPVKVQFTLPISYKLQ